MVSKLDNALAFQQAALGLRAYRQQVLASNIANADTPNYKARDFDFRGALQGAIVAQGEVRVALQCTNDRHLPASGDAGPAPLLYRTPAQASADGNTVEMDAERAAFSENAMRYEAGLTFITHQLKMLGLAVQLQS